MLKDLTGKIINIGDKVIYLYNILSVFEEEPEFFLADLKNKYIAKLNILFNLIFI